MEITKTLSSRNIIVLNIFAKNWCIENNYSPGNQTVSFVKIVTLDGSDIFPNVTYNGEWLFDSVIIAQVFNAPILCENVQYYYVPRTQSLGYLHNNSPRFSMTPNLFTQNNPADNFQIVGMAMAANLVGKVINTIEIDWYVSCNLVC